MRRTENNQLPRLADRNIAQDIRERALLQQKLFCQG